MQFSGVTAILNVKPNRLLFVYLQAAEVWKSLNVS